MAFNDRKISDYQIGKHLDGSQLSKVLTMVCNFQDYGTSGLCQSSNVPKNKTFRKETQFPKNCVV
jgi:hypothetical protein